MDIKELIELARPTIDEIKKPGSYGKVLMDLFNTPQPEPWISREKSSLLDGEFEYNKIQLVEALMNEVFDGWYPEIKNYSVTQEKSVYAVTVSLDVHAYISSDAFIRAGIATTFAPSIKHLAIATPLAKSEAKKNGIKELGVFFGRGLNRFDNQLPIIQLADEKTSEIDQEFETLKSKLIGMQKGDAEMLLQSTSFRFHPELKKIVTDKK